MLLRDKCFTNYCHLCAWYIIFTKWFWYPITASNIFVGFGVVLHWKQAEGQLEGNNDMIIKSRSSHRSCSMKKDVLKSSAIFTGKHVCQSLFFNKVARPFLQNTSGLLLPKVHIWKKEVLGFCKNHIKSSLKDALLFCD